MKTKFRLLNAEELQLFEKEFVEFLVVNGITADEWLKIKEENKEKGEGLIQLFSNLIFEKITKQAKFLDYYSENTIHAVQCLPDKMILVAINRLDPTIDLTTTPVAELNADQFELIKGEKKYEPNREEELFDYLNKGYEITDGTLFKHLIMATV